MSGTLDLDGLCGIIHLCATSDLQVRCKYKFGHDGLCSWKKTEAKGWVTGIFVHPVEEYTQNKNEQKD